MLTPVLRIVHQRAEPRNTPTASNRDEGVPEPEAVKPVKIAAKDKIVSGLAAVNPSVER